ncbi:hypothetical protein, partial [Flavonifractor plautii]|uniref:hypothetical protein n=1 Tax=Flavonifractor plautii TaxID=292800 RepID=UPI001D08F4CD
HSCQSLQTKVRKNLDTTFTFWQIELYSSCPNGIQSIMDTPLSDLHIVVSAQYLLVASHI